MSSNNQIHLTVKSVTPFAIAKVPPLFTSSDLGVIFHENEQIEAFISYSSADKHLVKPMMSQDMHN